MTLLGPFYSQLYESESPKDNSEMLNFFAEQNIPNISTEDKNNLEIPISIAEIIKAITLMNSGKSPRPDGFCVEFFKKFSKQLAPLLLGMFNESLQQGTLPPTLRQAAISLIHKKGKDPDKFSSYRPVSLLNVDVKILAKVLASRLETVLPTFMSEDQTGFIKNRHSFTNVPRLLNIVFSPSSTTAPEGVISLDAEKAFDRVEWKYLFFSLHKFSFGEHFITWVPLLYTSPQACVCTSAIRSTFFPLTRGTRQGWPLSPLLFAIAIEPLSIVLKTNRSISGIRRGGAEHKVSLYADDLLLYVSNPKTAISHILDTLKIFGTFSEYKFNIGKSDFFPINELAGDIVQSDLPFTLSLTTFKYLGVNVSRKISLLFDNNFSVLNAKVKEDLQKCNSLQITLAGRIQSIKMNIVPRYLYLFQCLSLFLPRSFFRSIDSLFSSFIWSKKSPRLQKLLLQRNKAAGSLGLPNLQLYYWAANLQNIVHWAFYPKTQWCQLESHSCHFSSLKVLVCHVERFKPKRYTDNPIVISTLKIWQQIKQYFGWNTLPLNTPICNNDLFKPAKIDARFSRWEKQGLSTIADLYSGGTFSSFAHLCSAFNLQQSDHFRYFQIRHFLKSNTPSFPDAPPSSGIDNLLLVTTMARRHISFLYDLLTPDAPPALQRIKSEWETELGVVIPDDWWNEALEGIKSCSTCARFQLIQFKIVHRAHYSKSRLAKIYPNLTDTCDRCLQATCNLTHMFWSCPRLGEYWRSYFRVISVILEQVIDPSPQTAIFGIPEAGVRMSVKQTNVISFTSLLARRRILLLWKKIAASITHFMAV